MLPPRGTLRLFALGVAAIAGEASCTTGTNSVKDKAENVLTISRNEHRDLEKKLVAAFAALGADDLAAERIKSYDTRTLELLFQAAFTAGESSERSDLTPLMETIFEDTYRRGFVGDSMIPELQTRYVMVRAWDKARALHARFPSMASEVPDIQVPSAPVNGPTVYEVSDDGKTLTLEPVDLVSRPIIVAVVSGGCHFSHDAAIAIAADPKLSRALAENAIYVDPSPYELRLNEIAENNRTQRYKVRVLYKTSGWPGLDFRRTPHFYFLKDGRVVHDVVGAVPSLATDLEAGLVKLGLS